MRHWHRSGSLLGIMVVAAMLGACGSSDAPGDAGGVSSSASVEPTGPAEGTGTTDPLAGTWHTAVLSMQDQIQEARDAGCSQDVIDAFHYWPVDAVHTLTFQDGQVVESVTQGDGAPEVGSQGTYEPPTGGVLVLVDGYDGSRVTLDMELDGDVLTLRLKNWDCNSPEGGVPQTFIFQGAFTREA